MLLDRESRKMLDALIAAPPDCPGGIYTYDYICETCSVDRDAAKRVAQNLEEKNLAHCVHGSPGIGVVLTQDGRCYKELRALESRARWKERIVGFIFGVLTTLAATFVTRWLG